MQLKRVGLGVIEKDFDGKIERIACNTVQDIATAVGLPLRTLYPHFTQALTGKGMFKKWEFGPGVGCILG